MAFTRLLDHCRSSYTDWPLAATIGGFVLQEIDPFSVGILFQNRYRIVRCIKGGPPRAVYDVVDEETNACCLLEVVASGAVAVENLGDPAEIESRIGGVVEEQQTIKVFEPGIDETTGGTYFVTDDDIDELLETNPLQRDTLDADEPSDIEAIHPGPVVPVPIPLPPIPPSLATKPVLPPPPPLRANPLPQALPPLAAPPSPPPSPPRTLQSNLGGLPPLNPPPRFPPKNGEITPGVVPQLLPVWDSAALFQLPHQGGINPLLAAAAQIKTPPSAVIPQRLRDSWRPHRGAAAMIAIGCGLVALGLWGLWTHRKQDVRVGETNHNDSALEVATSEKVVQAPIVTHSNAEASPSAAGAKETGMQRAAPATTAKTPDKLVRATGRKPSPAPKTKAARESLY